MIKYKKDNISSLSELFQVWMGGAPENNQEIRNFLKSSKLEKIIGVNDVDALLRGIAYFSDEIIPTVYSVLPLKLKTSQEERVISPKELARLNAQAEQDSGSSYCLSISFKAAMDLYDENAPYKKQEIARHRGQGEALGSNSEQKLDEANINLQSTGAKNTLERQKPQNAIETWQVVRRMIFNKKKREDTEIVKELERQARLEEAERTESLREKKKEKAEQKQLIKQEKAEKKRLREEKKVTDELKKQKRLEEAKRVKALRAIKSQEMKEAAAKNLAQKQLELEAEKRKMKKFLAIKAKQDLSWKEHLRKKKLEEDKKKKAIAKEKEKLEKQWLSSKLKEREIRLSEQKSVESMLKLYRIVKKFSEHSDDPQEVENNRKARLDRLRLRKEKITKVQEQEFTLQQELAEFGAEKSNLSPQRIKYRDVLMEDIKAISEWVEEQMLIVKKDLSNERNDVYRNKKRLELRERSKQRRLLAKESDPEALKLKDKEDNTKANRKLYCRNYYERHKEEINLKTNANPKAEIYKKQYRIKKRFETKTGPKVLALLNGIINSKAND